MLSSGVLANVVAGKTLAEAEAQTAVAVTMHKSYFTAVFLLASKMLRGKRDLEQSNLYNSII